MVISKISFGLVLVSMTLGACASRKSSSSENGDEAQGIRGINTREKNPEANIWLAFNLKAVAAGDAKVCVWTAFAQESSETREENSSRDTNVFLNSASALSPFYIKYNDLKNHISHQLKFGPDNAGKQRFLRLMDEEITVQKDFETNGQKSPIERMVEPGEFVYATSIFGERRVVGARVDADESRIFYQIIKDLKEKKLVGLARGGVTNEKCPKKENVANSN